MRPLEFITLIVLSTASVGNAFKRTGLRIPNSSVKQKMCIDRVVNQELIDVSKGTVKEDSDPIWRSAKSTIVPIELPKFEGKPSLITFDSTDTLIELSQSVGRWYREALNEATDMQIRLPRPALFTTAFVKAYEGMSSQHPCFGAKSGMDPKDWWFQVVSSTYRYTENLDQVSSEELDAILPRIFEKLYTEIFSSSEGWLLKENAEYTLKKLAEWRDIGGGPKLGIISNFDGRLHNILRDLGILHYFDFVLCSSECKYEKPESEIFLQALSKVGVKDLKSVYHIGNSISKDVAGAFGVGLNAIRFNEWFDEDFPDWTDTASIQTSRLSAEKQLAFYTWGRKDTSTGLQWTEIWDLTDILTLFGFPDDDKKPIKTTYIRNVKGDF